MSTKGCPILIVCYYSICINGQDFLDIMYESLFHIRLLMVNGYGYTSESLSNEKKHGLEQSVKLFLW